MRTGLLLTSCSASSAETRITVDASVYRSQSQRQKGPAIIREAMYSSMVICFFVMLAARGFLMAFADPTSAICASCSRSMPYLLTWRCAYCPIQLDAEIELKGNVHCCTPSVRLLK